MAAYHTYTFLTGYQYSVQVPDISKGGCSAKYNGGLISTGVAGLVAGSDPTADQSSNAYLNDLEGYLTDAIQSAKAQLTYAKTRKTYWTNIHSGCKGCCSFKVFGTCITQCCCHCRSAYCDMTQDSLNAQKNSWNGAISSWNSCLQALNDLLLATATQIAINQGQALEDALINITIAETNYLIAQTNIEISKAHSEKVKSESEERIAKLVEIVFPIVIIILLIWWMLKK